MYGRQTKSGAALATILKIGLDELSQFQKPERKHVKQGMVVPASQVLSEVPGLQPEAVLLLNQVQYLFLLLGVLKVHYLMVI